MLLSFLLAVAAVLASDAKRGPAAEERCLDDSISESNSGVVRQHGSALLQASVGRQRATLHRNTAVANVSKAPQHEAPAFEALVESASTQAVVQELHSRISMVLEFIFPQYYAPTWMDFIRLTVYSTAIWCTLILATAWRYKSRKRWPDMEQASLLSTESDFQQWTSGPFECWKDLGVCFWACTCPCIRWADSLEMAGIVRFWVGLSLFGNALLLNSVPSAILLWFVASLCWMAFRQQFRRRFDMDSESSTIVCTDWALYCFCCPCAIAQEARHVEAAFRAGHKAVVSADFFP